MKFNIVRSTFIDGLKAVQNIVAGKGSLQILQNVHLEAADGKVIMTTTDLDISIRSVVECEVIEKGMTTLPVRILFTSISKVAEGIIEVTSDEMERTTIKAGSARFRITGMPASEFPKLPEGKEAKTYTLDQAVFKEMLRKTSYAASQDDTRRTLKGVLMSFKDSKLTMVATDGRRLAHVEHEIEFSKANEGDIVLPAKAVNELQRSLTGEKNITVSIHESQICFNLEGIEIYSKLIEDVYPNYKQVIPTEERNVIAVDRQLLLNALDRASVMTMDEAHSTKLIFDQNELTVISAASDIGEAKDVVAIKYAGERIEIMFNPTYMMDCLKAIDDDEITITINDGHSPAVIRCGLPFIYVIMPLRVNG